MNNIIIFCSPYVQSIANLVLASLAHTALTFRPWTALQLLGSAVRFYSLEILIICFCCLTCDAPSCGHLLVPIAMLISLHLFLLYYFIIICVFCGSITKLKLTGNSSHLQIIPEMLESGVRVLIYAGDVDFICNW